MKNNERVMNSRHQRVSKMANEFHDIKKDFKSSFLARQEVIQRKNQLIKMKNEMMALEAGGAPGDEPPSAMRARLLQTQKKKVDVNEEKNDEPDVKLPMNVIQYIEKVSPERIVQMTINYMDDRQSKPVSKFNDIFDTEDYGEES